MERRGRALLLRVRHAHDAQRQLLQVLELRQYVRLQLEPRFRRPLAFVAQEERLARSLPNLLKSVLANLGLVLVGFGIAFLGTRLDAVFGWRSFDGLPVTLPRHS